MLFTQVSVRFNKAKAEPGQDVDVIVSADANSVVNLLAVDQSVILLKSGNDITPTQVPAKFSFLCKVLVYSWDFQN